MKALFAIEKFLVRHFGLSLISWIVCRQAGGVAAFLALEFAGQVPPMSMVANLLFFRSYRSPQGYIEQLQRLGFQDIRQRDLQLDSSFFVVTARKPGE